MAKTHVKQTEETFKNGNISIIIRFSHFVISLLCAYSLMHIISAFAIPKVCTHSYTNNCFHSNYVICVTMVIRTNFKTNFVKTCREYFCKSNSENLAM